MLGKTPGYAPLEQMGNDVVKFLPATDIYALGATLYKLVSGITPMSANLLASGEELDPLPTDVSPSVRKAIMRSMNVNKSKRPQTIDDFLALLSDETNVFQPSQASKKQTFPIHEEETKLTNEEETLVNGESRESMQLDKKQKKMTLGEAVKTCFTKKYFKISGRATRAEYWWFQLFILLVILTLSISSDLTQSDFLYGVMGFFCIFIIIPAICVLIRRLHDAGFSGWFALLSFIPYLGGIALLVMTLWKSDNDNKWGLNLHKYL